MTERPVTRAPAGEPERRPWSLWRFQVGALTWHVPGGDFPPGLSLDTDTGAISGTPSAAGAFLFRAEATDTSIPPRAVAGLVRLRVAEPLAVPSQTLPTGVVGSEYVGEIAVSGGIGPYTFSLGGGDDLHDGLSLATDAGAILGVPVGDGTRSPEIIVSDSAQEHKRVIVTTSNSGAVYSPVADSAR